MHPRLCLGYAARTLPHTHLTGCLCQLPLQLTPSPPPPPSPRWTQPSQSPGSAQSHSAGGVVSLVWLRALCPGIKRLHCAGLHSLASLSGCPRSLQVSVFVVILEVSHATPSWGLGGRPKAYGIFWYFWGPPKFLHKILNN